LNLKWTAAKKGKVISVIVGGKQNTNKRRAVGTGENAHDKCSCWHQISPLFEFSPHVCRSVSLPAKSRRPSSQSASQSGIQAIHQGLNQSLAVQTQATGCGVGKPKTNRE